MFFSFPITSKLILELKNYGYEDCIYFDEKNCCKDFSIIMLKAIKNLSIKYHSKASLWYRNFLLRKFKNKNYTGSIPHNGSREKLDERFYNTYLSDVVCKKNIKYEDFMADKHKFVTYHNKYKVLDSEIGTRTTFYNLDKHESHRVRTNEKNKIFCMNIIVS